MRFTLGRQLPPRLQDQQRLRICQHHLHPRKQRLSLAFELRLAPVPVIHALS